jgi:heme A synthase
MAFSGEYMVPIQDAQKLERELADMTKQRDALAEIYPLLASAWFYGKWIAETYNEREIQKIMERQGWWPFESESDLMTALSATKGGGL